MIEKRENCIVREQPINRLNNKVAEEGNNKKLFLHRSVHTESRTIA